MKQVLLHIGMHKTGSSSIQQSLAGFDDGRTLYSKIGVNHSAPMVTIFKRDYLNYHIWQQRGLGPKEVEARRTKFIEILDAELSRSDRERLIISGEGMSILQDDEKRSLIDYIKGKGCEIKVIAYARDPLSFAASVTLEKIRGGRTDKIGVIRPDYKKRIGPFVDLVGRENVVVREFNRERLIDRDVVRDFAQTIDIDLPADAIVVANESLPEPAAKLLLNLNRSQAVIQGNRKLIEARDIVRKELRDVYSNEGKLDEACFARSISCPDEDIEFLKGFGINFETYTPDENDSTPEAYLTDLSSIDRKPLDQLLKKYGIDPKPHKTIRSRLIALFYAAYYLGKR